MPRLNLRNRLLVSAVVLLLPVFLLLIADSERMSADLTSQALDEQLITAQSVAVQADESFDAAVGVAWAVANDSLTQAMDPRQLDPHLQALTRSLQSYEGIDVFDSQGVNRGWGHLTTPAEPRLNIADRSYFKDVMARNAPVISPVLQLTRANVVGVVAAVPVRGQGGNPVGTVTVVVRTDQLASSRENQVLAPTQAIFLADPTGRIAFHTGLPGLTYDESSAFANFAPLRSALAGSSSTEQSFRSPFLDDVRMGAFVPTARYAWAVGVTVNRDRALAPAQAELRDRLLAFAGILLLSLLLATLVSRRLADPIRQLAAGARAFGQGNPAQRVDVHTGDEVEQLAHSFNEMADQIEARQTEAHDFRREAERRAAQLSAVIDSMTDAVFIAGSDGRLVDMNPAARNLVGPPEDASASSDAEENFGNLEMRFLDGRPVPAGASPLSRAAAGQVVSAMLVRSLGADGEERILSINGAPVRDEAGSVVLGVIVARDVTELRHREAERAAVAEIARALVREIELERVAAVVMEQSVRVLGADAAEVHLADQARQQLDLLAHNHGAEHAERIAAIQHVGLDTTLLAAEVARSGSVRIVDDVATLAQSHPLGFRLAAEEDFVSLMGIPLQSRERLVGVVTLLSHRPNAFSARDQAFYNTVADLFAVAIENAHLYTQVRDALRLREEFIATAAHELKTPVTVIKGWAQLLLLSEGVGGEHAKALETIDRQADRVSHFIDDILSVANLRPGLAPASLETLDLAALAASTAESAARQLGEITVNIAPSEPLRVRADRQLITEVMTRLLQNAARYSPSGSQVDVEAHRTGTQAVVSVRDHGVGIPPERQPYVFEPFYQAVPAGAPGYVGVVSLGLHLSKQIVEALGGQIWFASTAGHGSTFSFSLPLAE